MFRQNSSLLNHWTLFTLVMSWIIAIPMVGADKALFTMFWLHDLLYFAFIDLFHGVLLPLTIISVPVEPEKTFSVRTILVLEPRRPGASELVKSGRSLVDKNIEYGTEMKSLYTLTPRAHLERSKELIHDQPILFPLRAESKSDPWNLLCQVETIEVENQSCNHVKVPAPREERSLKSTKHHSHSSSSHNRPPDPKDFQHLVNSILNRPFKNLFPFFSYEFRKCSQNELLSLAGAGCFAMDLIFHLVQGEE